MRILWVTGAPDVIEGWKMSLELEGHKVVVAEHTKQAWQLISESNSQSAFDLIIVEEVLAPGTLDPETRIGTDNDYARGAALIRKLNSNGFKIPVVAIESAINGSLDRVAKEDLGFPIEIVHAPITTHRFSKVLEQITNRPT